MIKFIALREFSMGMCTKFEKSDKSSPCKSMKSLQKQVTGTQHYVCIKL